MDTSPYWLWTVVTEENGLIRPRAEDGRKDLHNSNWYVHHQSTEKDKLQHSGLAQSNVNFEQTDLWSVILAGTHTFINAVDINLSVFLAEGIH